MKCIQFHFIYDRVSIENMTVIAKRFLYRKLKITKNEDYKIRYCNLCDETKHVQNHKKPTETRTAALNH